MNESVERSFWKWVRFPPPPPLQGIINMGFAMLGLAAAMAINIDSIGDNERSVGKTISKEERAKRKAKKKSVKASKRKNRK